MRRAAATAAVLVLAACNQARQPPENQATATEKITAEANTSGGVAEPTPANEGAATGKALPPANGALRFVGTWAATEQECASKPWRFTAEALQVEGGPECSFYKVSAAPGGYNVAATCPTKKPVHTDLIRLRFAESAQAMLVESNVIPPTGLVYCGT